MKDTRRVRALLLCAAFAVMLFVSAAYLAHEAGHDCCGEDCPVCRVIAMVSGALRAFGLLLLVFLFAVSPVSASAGGLRIVTTVFPIYDWVREITSGVDQADITMLLDSGTDLHSFQPAAQDIMKVASCDVFIYGGESDEWVEDALAEAVNPDMTVISLVDVLGEGAKAGETVEGMEAEEEEGEDVKIQQEAQP